VRVDSVGGLPADDERGVYRQRIAPSRLKSTARRLVKRRVGKRVSAQAFRASRRNTTSRSPRSLTMSTKILDHVYQNSRKSTRLSNADIESPRSRYTITRRALFPRFSSTMDDNAMGDVLSISMVYAPEDRH
jgi:hypothetical protein